MEITVKKVSLHKVNENMRGDIYCGACFYRAQIKVEEPWASAWASYLHPKHLIVKHAPGYQQFAYITPNAIKFVLDHLGAFMCPKCNKVGLFVNPSSKYNPTLLLKSFKLCANSTSLCY